VDHSGRVTSSSPRSRPGEYPASRQAVPGCRPDTAAGEEQSGQMTVNFHRRTKAGNFLAWGLRWEVGVVALP